MRAWMLAALLVGATMAEAQTVCPPGKLNGQMPGPGQLCNTSSRHVSQWPDPTEGCCIRAGVQGCRRGPLEPGNPTCATAGSPTTTTTKPTTPLPTVTTTTKPAGSTAPPSSVQPTTTTAAGPSTTSTTLAPGQLPTFTPMGWMFAPQFYLTDAINYDPFTGDVATQSNRVMLLDYGAQIIVPAVLDWAHRFKPEDGTLRSHLRDIDGQIWGGWQVEDCCGALWKGSGRAFEVTHPIYQRDRCEDRVEYWRQKFLKAPELCAATAPANVHVLHAMDLRIEPATATTFARCVAGARVPCAWMRKPGDLCPIVAPKFHKTTPSNATAGTLNAKAPHPALTDGQCRMVREQVNPSHMACSDAIITDNPNTGAICSAVEPLLVALEATARTWFERTLLTARPFPTTIDWGPPVGAEWTDSQKAARATAVKDRFRKADVAFMAWSETLCPGPGMTPGPIDGLKNRKKKLAHDRQHMFIASRLRGPLREPCDVDPVNNCPDTLD